MRERERWTGNVDRIHQKSRTQVAYFYLHLKQKILIETYMRIHGNLFSLSFNWYPNPQGVHTNTRDNFPRFPNQKYMINYIANYDNFYTN